MAYEYIASRQDVLLNQPIIFNSTVPCRNGNIFHENGTGIFLLNGRNIKCNCNNATAQYLFEFTGNIAIPEGGTVGPIAVALAVDGNVIPATRAIVNPAAVENFWHVSIAKVVQVPKICGCESATILAVSGLVDDPTGTPAPVIDLLDGNLLITRTS